MQKRQAVEIASRPGSAPTPVPTKGRHVRSSAGAAAGRPGAYRNQVDLQTSGECLILRDRLDAASATRPRFSARKRDALGTPSDAPPLAVGSGVVASPVDVGNGVGLVRSQSAAAAVTCPQPSLVVARSTARHGESGMLEAPDRPAESDIRADLLGGTSRSAAQANRRGAKNQRVLQSTQLLKAQNPIQVRRTGFTVEVDEHFGQETDNQLVSIEDLRNRHQAFEGPLLDRSFGGNAQQRKAQRDMEKDRERELAEKRAVRFQAYKWCRKLEPELPPLSRSTSLGEISKRPKAHMLLRNLSSKALEAQSPPMRKAAQRQRQLAHARQCEAALRNGQEVFERQLAKREEKLDAKLRHIEGLRHGPLTASISSWSVEKPVEEVARHQSLHERSPNSLFNSDVLPEFFSDLAEGDEKKVKVLVSFVLTCRRKLALISRRKKANKIKECMLAWKQKGAFFIMALKFKRQVSCVQAWWRACRARLRTIRDALSQRWVQLEIDVVGKELLARNSGMHGNALPTANNRRSPKLMSESTRNRFLEAELRARRYFILPALSLWEQDVENWDAAALAEDAFRWAPHRPSYVPAGHHHPVGECPPDCPGRAGDAELLAMVQAARKDPLGWQKVPAVGPPKIGLGVPGKNKTSMQKETQQPSTKKAKEDAPSGPFGEVSGEDLCSWGVDPELLPKSCGPKAAGLVELGEDRCL